jgi:hypothetical protein
MTAPTINYTHDGCLQTPCPDWCDTDSCDGSVHCSEAIEIGMRQYAYPLALTVEQYADDAEPYLSLEDAWGRRHDKFSADEAERLGHALLNYTKILRAHAEAAGR